MNALKMALELPFPPNQIHWRVGATTGDKSKGIALAYIDARDVMRRLDEACGFGGWQNRYTLSGEGVLICEIGIRMGEEWLWRANGAGETQVEGEKGKASDAFKRAAVMWGVGRYLYNLPNTWAPLKAQGRSYVIETPPQLPQWATPDGYMAIMRARESKPQEVQQ